MDVMASGYTPFLIGGAVVAASCMYLYTTIRKRRYPTVRRDYPANTVVLRQPVRGPFAPSFSPFAVKLETYLRIAKIPFVCDFKSGMSSKGKIPWISYNDEDVVDTEFCIEYLNKKFDVDLDNHLSREEKAVARAFQRMVDEHLFWVILSGRWIIPEYKELRSMMLKHFKMLPTWLFPFVRRNLGSQAYGQGMGRHSPTEMEHIAEVDYSAISHFLGQKPFLMGAEPCEADCAVFAILGQIKWQMTGTPHETLVNETYPNLSAYCDRMKEKFWPDWDDCITHGGTTTPSK